MARGRFISNAIMSDKKINQLSDDTSRLAFTWLITTADSEGRTHGDPAMVRSLLFPRRVDISVEQMEAYITEWYTLGLITWYQANGDLWIALPNFDKYQVGLRKDREPESQIPSPDDGELQPILEPSDGSDPANIRQTSGLNKVKRSKDKLKLREGKGSTRAEIPPSVTAYREAAQRYPNKSLYSLIDSHVGIAAERVSFWREVVTAYIALGWNPSNIQGQLDWFDKNELPHKNGTTKNPQPLGGMLGAIARRQGAQHE